MPCAGYPSLWLLGLCFEPCAPSAGPGRAGRLHTQPRDHAERLARGLAGLLQTTLGDLTLCLLRQGPSSEQLCGARAQAAYGVKIKIKPTMKARGCSPSSSGHRNPPNLAHPKPFPSRSLAQGSGRGRREGWTGAPDRPFLALTSVFSLWSQEEKPGLGRAGRFGAGNSKGQSWLQGRCAWWVSDANRGQSHTTRT